MSRESAQNAPPFNLLDAFDRVKEQLYLASLAKDVSSLQHAEESELQMELIREHRKLTDQITVANDSVNELGETNKILTDQLAQCRGEFQLVVSERDELQKQLHISKGEVGELSSRINELQSEIEMSVRENAGLSSELFDCRNLLATLQVQHESLSGSLDLLSEENKKLLEEKGNFVLQNGKLGEELAESKALLGSLQFENAKLLENFSSLSQEQSKFDAEKEHQICENEKLLAELADCKDVMGALQAENNKLNEVLISVTEEKKQLQDENQSSLGDTEKLALELKDSKSLVEALQVEVSEARGHMTSLMEERKKLEEKNEYFLREAEKQTSQLIEYKNTVAGLQEECCKVEDDMKYATLRIENLTEENMHLKSSLQLHETVTKESPDQIKLPSQSKEAGDQPKDSCKSSFAPSNVIDDDGSIWFGIMKRHLEEGEEVVEQLEKAIEEMHSHSASLGRSTGKVAAPGVSKLIQAFEPTGQTDDHPSEELLSFEDKTDADLYVLIKVQTKKLRALLRDLMLEVGNGYQFLEGQSSRMTLADLNAVELKSKYESLNEQIYYLEGANVELMVFNETLTGCFQNAKEEKEALMVLNENLRKQEDYLKAENSQQRENLRNFPGKLSKLQHKLDEMRESFKGMGSYISNQVEALQKEVADRGSIFEEEWNSITYQVFQTLGKLDVSVDMVSSSSQSRKDSGFGRMDLSSHTVASVDAAIEVIGELWVQVEAARSAHEAMSNTSSEVNEQLNCLQAEKDRAIRVLHEVYSNLKKLVKETPGCIQKPEFDTNIENPVDPLQPGAFDPLLGLLQGFLGEMVQLEIINGELKSELADMTKVSEELNNRTLGSDFILKVVQVIEEVVSLDGVEIDRDEPVSCLESLISFLVQKYKEAAEDVKFSREEHTSKEDQVFNLLGQMDHLKFLLVQSENEIIVLRESVRRAEEEVVAIRSQYQDKVAEFEQSEQRISSLREKLGIAVTKGKGLIVQRDSLKQSLAETSSELDKCSQDLQLKDARLHELEMKLRTYSEAGERMEALESELSYIRNSATALRESFLLKDSVIQRIEEILEDLELPEHFQVKDIIDKVDWLAKSVSGNSRPPTDWDQKSSVGGSYSDSGYAVVGGWKEDSLPNLGSPEELRRRFEELQSKFYGLAEQNEMLEQSLIERNNLVQLWEEILDKIDMPSHLRSVEAEDRIGWLVHALSEAQNQYDCLKQKVENFEAIFTSKTAELEESHRRTSELEDAFKLVVSEKELISKNMESLAFEYEEMSRKAAQSDISNDDLQSKLSGLQEKLNQLLGTEERFHHLEGEIRRLQDLVKDVLQNSGMDDILNISDSTEYLEILLSKLIEKYTTLASRKPFDSDSTLERVIEDSDLSREEKGGSNVKSAEDTDVGVLSSKLEDALGDLRSLMEEREKFAVTNQSLVHELEAVSTKSKEVQDLLSQEEHKSASLREKLNVAVRKGKSLVQQRDSMKQLIEELHVEVEQLKSEIIFQKNAISDYEEKITNLSMEQESISIVESENTILRDQLAEREHTLSMILNSLDEVDIGSNVGNPVEKIKRAGEQCLILQSALTSSEQEVRKSKRAAELLLAELNEVQERNDGLQEELSMSLSELSELSNEKIAAEVAKREALARLEKLSSAHSEERKNQSAELMSLKSSVDQLREDLCAIGSSVNAILSKDLEILHNVGASMKVVLEPTDAKNHITLHAALAPVGIISTKSENKVFGKEIGSIKENLNQHSRLIYDEAAYISEIVGTIHEEITSHKQHGDSLKKEVMQLGSILKEKDSELCTLRRYNTMLFEACTGSVMEIETRRAQLVANSFASGASGVNTTFRSSSGGNNFIDKIDQYSEDGIRSVIEKLFMTVKDTMSVQNDIAEVGQKDLKTAISNLQKELQEKDIQRDKICKELVSQIKEAEAVSKSYLQELQLAKSQITDLQRKVDLLEEERNSLTHSINELQDQEAAVVDLQHRVQELENMMAAKEQENEALMQALDEEEAQMEDLKNQIGVTEKVLLQKNKEIENLEVSRGKATKKLSVTVSKFDELHHLSESLLSEVENLQSQLQERDTEISFLRQEVTRCTNDALVASQMSSSRNSDEINGFLTWLDGMISRVQAHNVQFDDAKVNQIHEYKDMLQKQLMSVISELEDLRAVAQTRDLMLKTEKDKVEQLVRKEEFLVNSLREKEFQLTMVRGVGDSAQITNSTSEITEIEPVANKWVVPGTAAPQVRSLRKSNNDQVAVAIDVDSDSGKLEEGDDDDKAHGFKSLTTSRIVPRFTRPVTNMIDGLWVSCDRALMRQPALRLGVIFYWAILHALLAAFVV